MGAEVVDLPGIVRKPLPIERPEPLAPDADTITLLEHLLEKARSGEIRGIGASWVRADGMTAHNWAGAPETCVTLLIGGLMFLVHEITRAAVDTATHQDSWEPEEGA